MGSPSQPDTLTADQINTLVNQETCPDCGSTNVLRGPVGPDYTDWTCGDCQMGFHIVTVQGSGFIVGERAGPVPSRACFYNPDSPEKVCEREECGKTFTGPGLYCCIACAMEDA